MSAKSAARASDTLVVTGSRRKLSTPHEVVQAPEAIISSRLMLNDCCGIGSSERPPQQAALVESTIA